MISFLELCGYQHLVCWQEMKQMHQLLRKSQISNAVVSSRVATWQKMLRQKSVDLIPFIQMNFFIYTRKKVSLWKDLEHKFVPVKESICFLVHNENKRQQTKDLYPIIRNRIKVKKILWPAWHRLLRKRDRENHHGKSE